MHIYKGISAQGLYMYKRTARENKVHGWTTKIYPNQNRELNYEDEFHHRQRLTRENNLKQDVLARDTILIRYIIVKFFLGKESRNSIGVFLFRACLPQELRSASGSHMCVPIADLSC